jgi:hypothetical protein
MASITFSFSSGELDLTLVVTDWQEATANAIANPAALSYIEMMCAAPREDNALARSILQTSAQVCARL